MAIIKQVLHPLPHEGAEIKPQRSQTEEQPFEGKWCLWNGNGKQLRPINAAGKIYANEMLMCLGISPGRKLERAACVWSYSVTCRITTSKKLVLMCNFGCYSWFKMKRMRISADITDLGIKR